MKNDRFRIKLKSIKSGEELTIFGSLLNKNNGLLHHPIEQDKWKIVSCDQTTGFFDKNEKEIFYSDNVLLNGERLPYEVIVNDFSHVAVIDNDHGQTELHKVYSSVEVV